MTSEGRVQAEPHVHNRGQQPALRHTHDDATPGHTHDWNARSFGGTSCDHNRLLAYLRRSPYQSERVWLPVARLAARFAHRRGVCRLIAPARVLSSNEPLSHTANSAEADRP